MSADAARVAAAPAIRATGVSTPIHQLHPPSRSVRTPLCVRQAQGLVLPVQLIPVPFTGHRPVPLHHALFFPAQDFVQVAGTP